VELTTRLHLVPRTSKMCIAVGLSLILHRLDGVVLNLAQGQLH
jgi:hypothetical protein